MCHSLNITYKNFLSVLFAELLFFSWIFEACFAQSSFRQSGIINDKRIVVLTHTGNGMPRLNFANTFELHNPVSLLGCLAAAGWSSEVGLDEQQLDKCNKLLEESSSFRRDVRDRIIAMDTPLERQQFAHWFDEASDRMKSWCAPQKLIQML